MATKKKQTNTDGTAPTKENVKGKVDILPILVPVDGRGAPDSQQQAGEPDAHYRKRW